jgi:hypothetical protein
LSTTPPNTLSGREIFDDLASQIIFLEVQRRRDATGYDERAILILDGYSAHHGAYCLDECTYAKIVPVSLSDHSSNQLQFCNLCVFRLTKHMIGQFNRIKEANV